MKATVIFAIIVLLSGTIFAQADMRYLSIDSFSQRWHIYEPAIISSYNIQRQPYNNDSIVLSVFIANDYYHFSTIFLDSLKRKGRYVTDNNLQIKKLIKSKKVLIPTPIEGLLKPIDSSGKIIAYQLNIPTDSFLNEIKQFRIAERNISYDTSGDYSNSLNYFIEDSVSRIYVDDNASSIDSRQKLFAYLKANTFYVLNDIDSLDMRISHDGIFYGGNKIHFIGNIIFESQYVTTIQTPVYQDDVYGPTIFEYVVNSYTNTIKSKNTGVVYSLKR